VRLVADLRPLRVSRDLRTLELGNLLSGLGTQAALVALPFQVYERTGSAFLTGLLGAAELGPIVVMGLWGGALADRLDRRTLLLRVQLGLFLTQAVLAAWTIGGTPPVAALYVLGGLLAGFGSVDGVARQSIIPNLVPRALLPSAVALNFGLFQATMVVGPGLGGLLIAGAGVGSAYAASAVGSLAMVLAASRIAPQPPTAGASPARVRASIAEGLRFVNGNSALKGSFAIDLMAMTFGMPRALFPVLAVSVYGAGAAGTGLLFSSVSAGAVAAVLLTGWVQHARRLGVIVLWAVAVWGLGIAAAGLTTSLWVAAGCFFVAGAADSVSAVCRSTINLTVTPDHLRGRMSSVFLLVVTGGPRLGDVEAGAVAGLAGPRFSVTSGGLACLAGVALVALAFPALVRYDANEWRAPAPEPAPATA
jgi:MFS family permease